MTPDERSFELERIYKKRIVPILRELKEDFFGTTEGATNVDLKTGMTLMMTGLRIMIKRNPDMKEKIRTIADEKSKVIVESTTSTAIDYKDQERKDIYG